MKALFQDVEFVPVKKTVWGDKHNFPEPVLSSKISWSPAGYSRNFFS